MITPLNNHIDKITCNSLESRNGHIIFGDVPRYGCELSKIESDVMHKMGGRLRVRKSSFIEITQPSGIQSTMLLPVLQKMWKKHPPATQIVETLKWF